MTAERGVLSSSEWARHLETEFARRARWDERSKRHRQRAAQLKEVAAASHSPLQSEFATLQMKKHLKQATSAGELRDLSSEIVAILIRLIREAPE